MRAEAGLHSVRASAALVPLRWLWRACTLVFGASARISRSSYLLAVLGLLAFQLGFEPEGTFQHEGYCIALDARSFRCFVSHGGESIDVSPAASLLVLLPFVWGGYR